MVVGGSKWRTQLGPIRPSRHCSRHRRGPRNTVVNREGVSMKQSFFLVIALIALLAVPVAAQEASPVASPTTGAPSAVASGLVNPRGFLWTDDGTLFVAQAGTGGTA